MSHNEDVLWWDKNSVQESKGENFLYIPLCSLSTPVANKSGSPRLMSLIRVPTHSIWSTLHHSSASRSVEMSERLTCTPSACSEAKNKSPPCLGRTWFTGKCLGGVIIEINPYGVFLGALRQPSYVLHIVELCNLKNEQLQICHNPWMSMPSQHHHTDGRHSKWEAHHTWTPLDRKVHFWKLWIISMLSLIHGKEG